MTHWKQLHRSVGNHRFLDSAKVFFLVFALHRALYLTLIAPTSEYAFIELAKFFVVGLWSDLWITFLLTLVFPKFQIRVVQWDLSSPRDRSEPRSSGSPLNAVTRFLIPPLHRYSPAISMLSCATSNSITRLTAVLSRSSGRSYCNGPTWLCSPACRLPSIT